MNLLSLGSAERIPAEIRDQLDDSLEGAYDIPCFVEEVIDMVKNEREQIAVGKFNVALRQLDGTIIMDHIFNLRRAKCKDRYFDLHFKETSVHVIFKEDREEMAKTMLEYIVSARKHFLNGHPKFTSIAVEGIDTKQISDIERGSDFLGNVYTAFCSYHRKRINSHVQAQLSDKFIKKLDLFVPDYSRESQADINTVVDTLLSPCEVEKLVIRKYPIGTLHTLVNSYFAFKSVKSLEMSDTTMDPQEMVEFAQMLLDKVKKGNVSLDELIMSNCKLGDKGFKYLAAVATSQAFIRLSLSHCSGGPRGTSALCHGLEINKEVDSTMILLDLSDNKLSNQGSTSLCQLLPELMSIVELRLAGTDLDFTLFTRALNQCTMQFGGLRVLDLSRNPHKNMKALVKTLVQVPALRSINLSGTGFSPSEFVFLVSLLKEKQGIEQISVVDLDIDVSSNRWTKSIPNDFLQAMDGFRVRRLSVAGNRMEPESLKVVLNALQRCEGLQSLAIGGNLKPSSNNEVSSLMTNLGSEISEMGLSELDWSVSVNESSSFALGTPFGQLLPLFTGIKRLDVSGNHLERGLFGLATLIHQSEVIEEVRWDRNSFVLQTLSMMEDAIKKNKSLSFFEYPSYDAQIMLRKLSIQEADNMMDSFERISRFVKRNKTDKEDAKERLIQAVGDVSHGRETDDTKVEVESEEVSSSEGEEETSSEEVSEEVQSSSEEELEAAESGSEADSSSDDLLSEGSVSSDGPQSGEESEEDNQESSKIPPLPAF